MSMLKVSDLCSGYGPTQILNSLSIEIKSGEVVTLIGSNGAGKTTLLRTITGLVAPSSGSINFEGERIDKLPTAEILKRGIVLVPEARQLFPVMSVRDNVMMGAYHPKVREGCKKRMDDVLDLFPRVRERLDQRAGTLSGGEQQMVAIARGLMSRPRLFMLDEPSLGLAPLIVSQVFEVMDRICKLGTTVLLVEQKVFHALRIANRAYVMENGSIAMQDTGPALLQNPHVKKAYLGI